MALELKALGWHTEEIQNMNILETQTAIQWIQNKLAREKQIALDAAHYHLLAQHKKTKAAAQKLYKQATKTKKLNPRQRPKVIDVIRQWVDSGVFGKK